MARLPNGIQKAKHDYSIHQDALLWSRIQALIAIQTGTLAGLFLLGQCNNHLYASLLAVLGIALTAALWIIAERDQLHREKSFFDSGVPESEIDPGFPFVPRGRVILRFVILLLIYSDVVALIVPWAERYIIAIVLSVLAIAFYMVLFAVTGRADAEVRRIKKRD